MEQMTNIIYLTTKCNLDCSYCYEANKRKAPGFKHFNVTTEQIDEFVKELEEREGQVPQSTIVIMGGEPTLAINELEYLIEKIIESTKKMGKLYFAKFTTNGIMLNIPKFYKKFWDLVEYSTNNGFRISLEISYDGLGQCERKTVSGDSSIDLVESAITKVDQDGKYYCISYTVHEKNWWLLAEDAIRIFERFPNVDRLSFSIAYQMLDNVKPGLGVAIYKEYTPIFRQIFEHYKKPICAFVCKECGICDKGNFTGNRYCSPTKGIMTAKKRTEHEFDQF